MTAPAGIVAREKGARVLADDQRRATVLARLRWVVPAGLSEPAVRKRLGWQVSVTPTLRELAELGEAHERNGVWFHGPARADAGGQSGVAPATTPPDREAPVSVAVDGGAAADPVPVQDPKTGTPLGLRLRAARLAVGLSQGALGARLGFGDPQGAISKLELGHVVRGERVDRVEAWLSAGDLPPAPPRRLRRGDEDVEWMVNLLPVRLQNVLTSAGLRTRDAVLAASDLDLLKTKNLGRKGLDELRAAGLRPDSPPPVAEEPAVADLADPAPGVPELPAAEPTLPGPSAALQPETGVPAGGDSLPPSSAPSEGVEGETSGGGLDLLRAQLCEILDGDDTWTDADILRAVVGLAEPGLAWVDGPTAWERLYVGHGSVLASIHVRESDQRIEWFVLGAGGTGDTYGYVAEGISRDTTVAMRAVEAIVALHPECGVAWAP